MPYMLCQFFLLLLTAEYAYPFTNLALSAKRSECLPASSTKALTEIEVVKTMPDPLPKYLKNNYYLLRHGQSTANVAGIISSSRNLAYSKKHGLTPLGYQQGIEASGKLIELLKQSDKQKVLFVSSPFARALETAEACLEGLSVKKEDLSEFEIDTDIKVNDDLMERYFGKLDGEALYTYSYVWPVDKFNVTHTAFDVESVAAVSTRLRKVIMQMEEDFELCNVVLVSHADVLQICQLYGAGAENVGIFSSFRFGNGEVRKMERTIESLPPPNPLEPPFRGTITEMPKKEKASS